MNSKARSTAQHGTARHSTAQHRTAVYRTAWQGPRHQVHPLKKKDNNKIVYNYYSIIEVSKYSSGFTFQGSELLLVFDIRLANNDCLVLGSRFEMLVADDATPFPHSLLSKVAMGEKLFAL